MHCGFSVTTCVIAVLSEIIAIGKYLYAAEHGNAAVAKKSKAGFGYAWSARRKHRQFAPVALHR